MRAPDHIPPLPEPTPPAPQMALPEWIGRLLWRYANDPNSPLDLASGCAGEADLALAAVVSWLRAQVDARAKADAKDDEQANALALALAADLLQDTLPGHAAALPDQLDFRQADTLEALPFDRDDHR